MGILLSDNDKLIIIIIAGSLILMTLLVTICLVSPWCLLYRLFVKSKFNINKNNRKLSKSYPSLNFNPNSESQHFHLSIVPVYGTKTHNCSTNLEDNGYMNINDNSQFGSINQFEHLTSLAEKARLRSVLSQNSAGSNSSCKTTTTTTTDNNSMEIMSSPKIEAQLYYKSSSESTVQIYIKIRRAFGLVTRDDFLNEPSPYVVVILSGYRVHRKGIIIKAVQNELFRTETVKRSLDAAFSDHEYVSEELPKNLIKEASIKLRLMDEQRYANDICLAELSVPLKKMTSIPENILFDSENSTEANIFEHSSNDHECNLANRRPTQIYTLLPIKEIKGELMAGFCYLPTSRRVNITIIKANIRNSILRTNGSTNHQAFFIKALMFYNGKLIKKKKTSLSIRLSWGKNETISFDLPDEHNQNISLMLILAYKVQNSNSPESPETPENPTNNKVLAQESNNNDPVSNNNNNSQQSTAITQTNAKNSNFNARKESFIGHFVLDKMTWLEEILKKPRNQILKWYKLY